MPYCYYSPYGKGAVVVSFFVEITNSLDYNYFAHTKAAPSIVKNSVPAPIPVEIDVADDDVAWKRLSNARTLKDTNSYSHDVFTYNYQ